MTGASSHRQGTALPARCRTPIKVKVALAMIASAVILINNGLPKYSPAPFSAH